MTGAFDDDVDGLLVTLRSACAHCGNSKGIIKVRGGQNPVYCALCSTYAGYNAPKSETGQRRRSVSTVRAGITTKVRAAVLARARGRCELCAVDLPALGWHVAHLLPVDVAFTEGLPDDVINSPANLAAFCEECNLGYKEIIDPVLWLVIMRRRLR